MSCNIHMPGHRGRLSRNPGQIPGMCRHRLKVNRRKLLVSCFSQPLPPSEDFKNITDINKIQTMLKLAVQQEDYKAASQLRNRLGQLTGATDLSKDWRAAGAPAWLADRLERLGFIFPTEVQKRSLPVVVSGNDTIITTATGSGKTLAFVVPCLANLDYPPDLYPDDLKGPQLVIVVPTMELGVQTSLLIYELYGGNIAKTAPGDLANMYTYQGPKGIKVKGVLNKEELVMAQATTYLRHTHVVVGTPACLAELCKLPGVTPILQHIKILAIDEADECFRQAPDEMAFLLSQACHAPGVGHRKPQVVVVGATLSQQDVDLAVAHGWLQDFVEVRPHDESSMPAGLQHRYVVCDESSELSVLVRLLRADMQEMSSLQHDARAIVFMKNEEAIVAAMEPLRTTLWTEHKLSVVLPKGEEPLRALQAFRQRQASLMLCTPQAARGLDLPSVTHIYNVGLPSSSADYAHQAGRAGRIGSTVPSMVTTLVSAADVPQLQQLGSALGIKLTEVDAPQPVQVGDDVEAARKNLDDLFNLY